MRYPDPLLLVRRIMLNPVTGRGAIYRSNRLNQKITWGLPVPFVMTPAHGGATFGESTVPTLVFENHVVPLEVYLECLLDTANIPADTSSLNITYFPQSETANRIMFLQSRRGEDHQARLTDLRNRCIQSVMHKLQKADPARHAEDVLREASIRLGMHPALVLGVMQETEGFTYTPRPKPGIARRRDPSLPWFHRGDPRMKVVKSALLVVRTNKLPQYPIMLDDLATTDPGGYPTRCPVTGLELVWDEVYSLQSVKVGRKDPSQPYGPENAALMSAYAKKLLEGSGAVSTLVGFAAARPEMLKNIRQWLDGASPGPEGDPGAESAYALLSAVEKRIKSEPTTNAPAEPTPAEPTTNAPAEPTTKLTVRQALGF